MTESGLAWSLVKWLIDGEVVFHIEASLVDAFLTSDIGEMAWRDVRLPFEELYLHFGPAHGLMFNGGAARLEGVLVSRHKSGSTGFTLIGELVEPRASWLDCAAQSFSFAINEDELDQPMEAVIDAISNRAQQHLTADPDEELKECDEATREDIKENWARTRKLEEVQLINRESMRGCLRLVANALLYITGYPDDVSEEWQEGTPQAFRAKVERATGKERARALSKARRSGFTRIHRVGKLFAVAGAADPEPGASPSPHWRRAHWRRQRHGPVNALVKVIWVRGTRVLGGATRGKPYFVPDDTLGVAS